MSTIKRRLLYVMSVTYVIAGVMHFIKPHGYVAMMPPALPYPLALVYISGVIEIGLGVALLVPKLTRLAAWGVVALLIAVYPANIYHAFSGGLSHPDLPAAFASPVMAWVRAPIQFLLLAWAWWYTRPPASA